MKKHVVCAACGSALGASYAVRATDKAALCPQCSAKEIEREMLRTGEATLYLVRDTAAEAMAALAGKYAGTRYVVTDWFGVLRFPVFYLKRGRHNIADVRADVWFYDAYGWEWHGVQYGRCSDLCYCRRTKRHNLRYARE